VAFVSAEVFIQQIKLPLTVHVLRVVGRNVIIFAHHLTIVLLVLAWFRPGYITAFLLFPLGVLILAINGVWLGILLGMVCARFRDIPPLVASLVQIGFFLTPVMWKAEMLGRHRWVADFNPFFHLLEIVRTPLLGQFPSVQTWTAVALITCFGTLGTFMFFSAFRARIAYWV
jgi:ABC-2 type transport system permease protein/lipopolysaccharide transport system permease protein